MMLHAQHNRPPQSIGLNLQAAPVTNVGYIEVIKQFKDNYPQTICRITAEGIKAFEEYVKNLQAYLGTEEK